MSLRWILSTATLLGTVIGISTAEAQPVTGLYVGGSGGANFLQHGRVESVQTGAITLPSNQRIPFDTGVVGLGSVGYGFGNGWRIELEGDYRQNRVDQRRPLPSGVLSTGAREQKYGPMVNVLFDLDVGSPYIFPYIGGGAGWSWVRLNGRTASLGGVRTEQGGTDGAFAYQAMAGLSFPVPPVIGLSLTAEYRFYALAGERDSTVTTTGLGAPVSSRVRMSDNHNHGLMLGLRYAFNVAPPAVASGPGPALANVAGRSFLVFFDWDRADLTARARLIVAEAAMAATRNGVTRIEVAGHTDRSGPNGYNQVLSVRRARAVMTELVRLGTPLGIISAQGFGETAPLVPTADGEREPQNRRVEIVLR